ncbi:MAG TPA: hypothetical protein VFM82_06075, partial [Flavobacteriaceae bacterium]|nr:hypothetical protein [Flavobacteriaceae bacterium]
FKSIFEFYTPNCIFKMLKNYVLLFGFCVFFIENSASQTPSFDFGPGAVISVGFQEEWAMNVRAQYHTGKKWVYLAEYNLFFRRDVASQNTETFGEVALTANYELFEFQGVSIYGGIGYTVNSFIINEHDPDTSNLYLAGGRFNHGAQLKFLGILPLGDRIKLFSDLNLKSFGRRYDTFSFGVLYSIQVGRSEAGGI